MKNPNDPIENQTGDFSGCSTVPQPTAPPRTPVTLKIVDRDSVVNSVTGLWAGRCGVRIPAEATDFYLHQNVPTGSGAHPNSYPNDTVLISREVKRLVGVMLTSRFHVAPGSRMV
jgi:hypothetical protein